MVEVGIGYISTRYSSLGGRQLNEGDAGGRLAFCLLPGPLKKSNLCPGIGPHPYTPLTRQHYCLHKRLRTREGPPATELLSCEVRDATGVTGRPIQVRNARDKLLQQHLPPR